MSMHKYIKVIADSEKIEKARQVKENCKILNLDYPEGLDDIIENEIEMPQKEYYTDYEEIIEINVKDIPQEAEKIQFIINY